MQQILLHFHVMYQMLPKPEVASVQQQSVLQDQDGALSDAWIGNMLMNPQKGKQEVLTTNNEVYDIEKVSSCISA